MWRRLQRERQEVYTTVNVDLQPDPIAFWLCQLPGMNSSLLIQLLAALGSAPAIMQTSSRVLREHGVPPVLIAKIVAGSREVPQVAAGLKGLQRLGIVPLPLASPTYPQRLLDLQQPPMVVYVLGSWPVLEPLALAVGPDEAEGELQGAWSEFVRSALPQLGFAGLEAALAADDTAPRLLGVPFGLMLARQRLPPIVWRQVERGATTLLATAPPTAQPQSVAATAAMPSLRAALVGLSGALVIAAPMAELADALLAMARTLGVPAFLFGQPPRVPLPPGVRRLRPGKAGARSLGTALGIKVAGTQTVQQERLF